MPSRGLKEPTAAHNSIVSPYRITQDPSACLATRPTSTVRSRSPTLIDSFKYFFTVISFVSFDDDRRICALPHGQASAPARSVSSAAICECANYQFARYKNEGGRALAVK